MVKISISNSNMTIVEQLKGLGFDVDSLREGEGALFSSRTKCPRAFSSNLSNESPSSNDLPSNLKEDEWCNYANMPSPKAYI